MIGNEERKDRRRRMQELLLAYLRAANAPMWPGVDGMTIDEVLRGYPEAAAAFVPDLSVLRQRHPELADVLNDLFNV